MLGFLLAPQVVAAQGNVFTTALKYLGSMKGGYATIDGKSWADMTIRERITTYDWTNEMYVAITFFVYITAYIWGRQANRRKVDNFVSVVDPVLQAQFGQVGCTHSTPIVKDSDTRYTTYASGRVNIESLLARFRLIERTNLMTYSMSFVVPSLASPDGLPDHINIELTPTDPKAFGSGIFSVVNKEALSEVQQDNYFLKLAKNLDSPELPSPVYMFMLEHSDQISELYTPQLKAALTMEGSASVLRMIAFSDVPTTEPKLETEVNTHPRVYLELNFPTNAAENAAVASLLEAALGLTDVLATKQPYRASTLKRINAAREVEFERIRKSEEEKKREELEAKKAEERREAARRERNLSEKEQRKLQKKESDKQARKQKQKMTRRK